MTTPCHRARSLVSQGLDAPLHDLEARFVAVHIAGCAPCRAFQADADAFTSLLRNAPLEPVPWPVGTQVRLPRHRVHFRALSQIASVASVVVAAGTIALVHEIPSASTESALVESQSVGPVLGDESIRSLRRDALVEGDLRILPVGSTAPVDPVKPPLPAVS